MEENGRKAFQKNKNVMKTIEPYIWLFPTMFFIAVFYLYPFLKTVFNSFFIINKMGERARFVGLENYQYLFADTSFFKAIKNTLIFVIITVPISKVIGLLLAVISNKKRRFSAVYECIYALPMAASFAVMSMIFYLMYNPNIGLINNFFHLDIHWLTDKKYAMPAIIMVAVWCSIGYSYLFLLSAIRGVPQDIIEYCELEGVGFWKMIRYIYLPLVSPTMFYLISTDLAGSVMMMAYTDFLTQGGPLESTSTIIYYMYKQGFSSGNFTNAYPIAVVAFLISLIFLGISFALEKRTVTY